jgi:hypothetical protein
MCIFAMRTPPNEWFLGPPALICPQGKIARRESGLGFRRGPSGLLKYSTGCVKRRDAMPK